MIHDLHAWKESHLGSGGMRPVQEAEPPRSRGAEAVSTGNDILNDAAEEEEHPHGSGLYLQRPWGKSEGEGGEGGKQRVPGSGLDMAGHLGPTIPFQPSLCGYPAPTPA